MRLSVDCRPLTAAPWSGIGRQNRALVNALAAHPDREVFPVTAAPAGHPVRQWAWASGRATPAHALHRPWHRCRFEAVDLPGFLSRQAIDVHIATPNMGVPWGPAARGCRRTRQVLQVHDLFQLTERNRHRSAGAEWFYRHLDRLSIVHAVRHADAIWVPSRWTAQVLGELLPGSHHRIRVLPNAVPVDAWRAAHPRPATAPDHYWLAVGTREPRKNIDRLIRAWQGGRVSRTDWPSLVLVGDPAGLTADLTGVTFVHGLSDEQLAAWVRHADCLWHPAWAEGFGLPVVEAAASGTPLAVARGSALDEVCPPQAWRFDPFDEAALRSLMHTLTQPDAPPPPEARQLQAWAARFDTPAYEARVEALLGELA